MPKHEVEPYFEMARRYAFASRMFQTNQGPSFPAYQYLSSGTSTIADGSPLRASENPHTPSKKNTGGCDSPPGSLVTLIDQNGNENQSTYPCFARNSLIQLVEARGLSWHYYQAFLGPGLWHAPDAIRAVRHSPEYSADVVAPSSQVLNDIDAGTLANVVWVTPTAAASDHAGITNGSGPSWVASVVNKIGQSKYWNDTAIFVTWDDWGGWFDPIGPRIFNSYELSFRVPLIVISPYAKRTLYIERSTRVRQHFEVHGKDVQPRLARHDRRAIRRSLRLLRLFKTGEQVPADSGSVRRAVLLETADLQSGARRRLLAAGLDDARYELG